MKQLYVDNRKEWRDWLRRNHNTSDGVWLVFYKKHTGKPSLDYDEAVEEALCFGWIDSIIKKLDEERYARKITPRNINSKWSDLNKKRVEKLDREGRMAAPGIDKVNAGRESGNWEKSNRPRMPDHIPELLQNELDKNAGAAEFFNRLAPSYRKQYIGWIASAKRADTRKRRVKEAVSLLEKGEKLGLR